MSKENILRSVTESNSSQPICIKIQTDTYQESYSVDLFDAVNRAFDFEQMQRPGVEVEGLYVKQGITYKRICRDLAIKPTEYLIGLVKITCSKGDFPILQPGERRQEPVRGLTFRVSNSDIQGTQYANGFYAIVDKTQVLKNIILCNLPFILRNDTVLSIENLPANSRFELFLFPEKIITPDKKYFTETTYKLPFKKEED